MANIVGVVGSSKKVEDMVDFLGRTPKEGDRGKHYTGVSDITATKAMFVSIANLTFKEGKPIEEQQKEILEDKWYFPTYFLMPDDVLLKQSLTFSEIHEVYKNLNRHAEVQKYICGEKPFIPTGDLGND